MLYGWGLKARWLILHVDGWQVKLRDPFLTRANLSALDRNIAHIIKRHTNVLFTYLLTTLVKKTSV